MKLFLSILFVLCLGACSEKQAAKTDVTVEKEVKAFKKGMNRIGDKIEEVAGEVKKDLQKATNKDPKEKE